MKARRCALVSIVIWTLVTSLAVARTDTSDLKQRAQALDMECRRSLGIGLLDLSLLMQAKPGAFLLEKGLRADNRLESVGTLEKLGLVTVSRSGSGKEVWIGLTPTDAGEKILSGISATGTDYVRQR